MKRFQDFFPRSARITGISLLVFAALFLSRAAAQQKSETAESLGLGGVSRFDTGYAPIVIDRTSIVPGVPFNVKPTMDNLVSGSKTSMGGILNRFDTNRFGQMFNGGPAAATVAPTSVARKAPAAPAAATVVAATPKIYPPRLELDEGTRGVPDDGRRLIRNRGVITKHLEDVLLTHGHDAEAVTSSFKGGTLTLRGQVDSPYIADVIVLTMEMEPGVEEVVSEITVEGESLPE